jgi:hypothetical protein
MEYFVSITRFDSAGRFIKRYSANDKMPPRNERIVDFYVSNSNKIYLNTFPHGRTHTGENPVYVYNLEGNLLGKVNYHIEDLDGDVYTFDTSPQNGSTVHKYKQTNTRPSRELSKLSEKEINENVFVGIDGGNNIYVARANVIGKYNANLQEVQKVQAPLKELEKDGIYSNHRNMRVGYDGTLYLFGQRRDLSKEKEGGHAKVLSVLVRLKKK